MSGKSKRIRRQAQEIRRRWPATAQGIHIRPTRFTPQSKRLLWTRRDPHDHMREACIEKAQQQ